MKVVKVSLKDAQEVLSFARKNKIADSGYEISKDKNSLFFAVSDDKQLVRKFPTIEAAHKKLNKTAKKKTDLKEVLADFLSETEIEKLITAYDIVGSIAIIEIPKELTKKEKLIAEALLKTQKNIKTVLTKGGIHEGMFRTQKMKFLAGIDTKETIHKENGVSLKLDVEKVYYSSRSATERKRVASLVKKKEDVLVMFSGCGPFVCVISKNSPARNVFGVELNPLAHKYAVENIQINKLKNAHATMGDCGVVVPEFYKYILGLKSNTHLDEMESRIINLPKIFEFHLETEDLFKGRKRLERGINSLQNFGVDVYLHMPFHGEDGMLLSLDKEDISQEIEIFNVLGETCKKFKISSIVHPYMPSEKSTKDKELFIKNIMKIRKWFDYFYFENHNSETLFGNSEQILDVARKTGMKKICIDICHAFMIYKDNDKLIKHIEAMQEFNLHYHLADSDGNSHGVAVGEGKIDFDRVLPFVKEGIVEVTSENELDAEEMINSFKKLSSKKKYFDRIVMPLPKSAESFLDTAFSAAKKGTVIHFYTFLKENEIPSKGKSIVEDAAKKAGRKIKVLDVVKCGSYSPKTFRVCVDFEVSH